MNTRTRELQQVPVRNVHLLYDNLHVVVQLGDQGEAAAVLRAFVPSVQVEQLRAADQRHHRVELAEILLGQVALVYQLVRNESRHRLGAFVVSMGIQHLINHPSEISLEEIFRDDSSRGDEED